MVFAMKMRLDSTYGLPNLFDFKINHFHLTSRMVIQQFKFWQENIIIFKNNNQDFMLVLKLNCLQTQHSHRRQLMHSHTSSPKQYSHTIRASPPLHPIQSDTDALLSQSAQLLHTRLVTKNVQNDRPAVAAYCNNTKIMSIFLCNQVISFRDTYYDTYMCIKIGKRTFISAVC